MANRFREETKTVKKKSKKEEERVLFAAKKKQGRKAAKKTEKTKRKSSDGIVTNIGKFLKNSQTHVVFGVFLLSFSLFLLGSFSSFLVTHQQDDDVFSSNLFETINNAGTSVGNGAENGLGVLGLYFSFLFIKNGFGIASFVFPFLFFLYAIRLIAKRNLLPLLKTTLISLLILSWISLFFAFVFSGKTWLGGEIGADVVELLVRNIGKPGVFLFLIGLLFVFLFLLGIFSKFKLPVKQENNSDPIKTQQETTTPIEEKKKVSLFARIFHRSDFKKQTESTGQVEVPQEVVIDNAGSVDAPQNDFEVIEKTNPSTLLKEPLVNTSSSEEVTTFIPGNDKLIDDNSPVQTNAISTDVFLEEHVDEEHPVEDHELGMDFDHEQIKTSEDLLARLGPYDPKADLPDYHFPSVDLLEDYASAVRTREQKELEISKNKLRIKETLENYRIQIQSISAIEGPTITLYEIVPAPGIRISKIKGLEDDIALSLAALGIRIIAPIPGKGTIGIEVPNAMPQIVPMKAAVLSEKFKDDTKMALPVAIGKTISDEVFVFDLAKMPHVLMAGATGQGKSVGLNAVLTSLLYKKHPSELKFVLVDPKKVELTVYSKIERHYLIKLPDSDEAIITDTKKVVKTLLSLCNEMDFRYELLKKAHCRNIIEYNDKFKKRMLNPENGHRFLPYIVLVFDEFADCIMTAGREVEQPIARLAQLARAIGIHLIIATQRPSVNIITGIIKANFPTRIAFRVASKIDSRTILDAGGAENLIGKGDMLISIGSTITRLQCALIDTPEIERICDCIGEQRAPSPEIHLPEVADEQVEMGGQDEEDDEFDACFADAAREVVLKQQGSTSFLQRKFKLGYNRAGRIMDQLEREKIVGPSVGSKTREVLIKDMITLEQFLQEKNLT